MSEQSLTDQQDFEEVEEEHAVHAGVPDVIVITGMSGAGRTEAMHTFEDLGYFCIDNLPPALIMNMVTLASVPGQIAIGRRLAIVCDARNREYFQQLATELANLEAAGVTYKVIFLDASDEVLLARYKASRRRHPLSMDASLTLGQAISSERALVEELRGLADLYIDTTNMSARQLHDELRMLYSREAEKEGLSVVVYSFGFKHGAPSDADIVIDVRFLPNPYYVPELKHLTGLDDSVAEFVLEKPQTQEFLACWKNLLDCVMPGYVDEGKQHLAIAVGCTGGQHRSVCLAEATGRILQDAGYAVRVFHRDVDIAAIRSTSADESAAEK